MVANLIFTMDVDNDGISINNERNSLSWNSISNIPKIKDLFELYKAKISWFVRADNQLKEIYGTSAYLLNEFKSLWIHLRDSGDEIGWHPHLYQWDEMVRKYIADDNDDRRVQKLRDTHSELQKDGFVYNSVRIGEAFQSNGIMAELCKLGLKVDSTAIPGRKKQDHSRFFDWEATPNEPYYPSKDDYRIPTLDGDYLSILEVPMTSIFIKASYDKVSLKRYINLSFHNQLFKDGFDNYINTIQKEQIFITAILHPDEISDEEKEHPLYSFSLADVQKNIEYMLKTMDSRGFEYRFLRMEEVLNYF